MTPEHLLVTLLVLVLILGFAFWAIRTMPIDAQARNVLYLIVAVAAILYLLRYLGVL